MADLVWVQWYATILRQEALSAECGPGGPDRPLRYNATQYAVHRSHDDRYKILQMTWFETKGDWYRYWEGPEMIEFRARNMGRFQVPITYFWADEIAAGALGPEVLAPEPEPEPAEPVPQAAA